METQQDTTRQRTMLPLGTFYSMGGDTSCHVIGWGYASWDPDYEDDPQIIVEKPTGTFVPAGITIGLMIPGGEDGDIPVYAEYEGDVLRRIVVDVTRWVEIGQLPVPWGEDTLDVVQGGHTNSLGYVTIEGRAILITDMHFLRLTGSVINYDKSQITSQEETSINVGVYVLLPQASEGQQYPVYAEYQGDEPVRVIVDLVGSSSDS